MFIRFWFKVWCLGAFVLACAVVPGASHAQDSKNLAPGFTARLANSKLVILPTDMELFSISVGGVQEPKADWTQSAVKHFKEGLDKRKGLLVRT